MLLQQRNLEVLKTSDADRWKEVLDEIKLYDFYHLPSFHRLAEIQNEGEAVLFAFRESNCVIAFPMLFRNIDIPPVIRAEEGYKDATSVYGFAGPIASTTDISEDIKHRFQHQLQDFLLQNKIISIFSRLSPIINQSSILSGYGETLERGVTVSIDLTPPPDEQFANYRKHYRKSIRQLKKAGLVCEKVGAEHLEDFIRIYNDTMGRVGAEETYRFTTPYFQYLMREMSDVFHLFICKYEGEIINASLCALCKPIIEIHLSGTTTKYLELSPSKVMHDAIREWGNSIGATIAHMGGGVGAQRDSLYDFKMGFGGQEHIYSTWRHVVTQPVYDDIYHELCRYMKSEPGTPYFPKYRHPELQPNIGEITR